MAIMLDSNNYLYYYNRGIYYAKKTSYQLAINDYKKSIDLNSKFAPSQNNLGTVNYKLSDFNKAIVYFDSAAMIELENYLFH